MTLRSRALALVISCALSGCYAAHERSSDEGTLPTGPDAGQPHDGGRDGVRDAAGPYGTEPDAGPPSPPEPDPDHGEDSRPSDYPDAGDWEDPPATSPDDPCCTLGDPVQVISIADGVVLTPEAPHIAWGPDRWGVAATLSYPHESAQHVALFDLAPDGTLEAAPHVLAGPATSAVDIRWAEGRWAVGATNGPYPPIAYARLFDREFRPVAGWMTLGPAAMALPHSFTLARLTVGDRWVALDDTWTAPFSDSGTDSPVIHPTVGALADAVGMRSRVAAVSVGEGDPGNHVVIIGAGPEYSVLAQIPLGTHFERNAAIAALRDTVVVVGQDDRDANLTRAMIVDPFAMMVLSGPTDIGTAGGNMWDLVDVAGSDKLGVAGICYGVEPPDGSGLGLDFRVIGPDGTPIGRAVHITDWPSAGIPNNCAVGASAEGFLVAWWEGNALWVRAVHLAD